MMRGDKDEAGIQASVNYVSDLIQKEINAGIPATRIIVGGFSQARTGLSYILTSCMLSELLCFDRFRGSIQPT